MRNKGTSRCGICLGLTFIQFWNQCQSHFRTLWLTSGKKLDPAQFKTLINRAALSCCSANVQQVAPAAAVWTTTAGDSAFKIRLSPNFIWPVRTYINIDNYVLIIQSYTILETSMDHHNLSQITSWFRHLCHEDMTGQLCPRRVLGLSHRFETKQCEKRQTFEVWR